MVYRMIFNQTAYFGRGAVKEIPAVAKQHGFTKAFIVTDPVLLETGTAEKVNKSKNSHNHPAPSRNNGYGHPANTKEKNCEYLW